MTLIDFENMNSSSSKRVIHAELEQIVAMQNTQKAQIPNADEGKTEA